MAFVSYGGVNGVYLTRVMLSN